MTRQAAKLWVLQASVAGIMLWALDPADFSPGAARWSVLFALWGAVVLTGSLPFLYMRKISKRVRSLENFAKRLGRGERNSLPSVIDEDEISALTAALNTIALHVDRTVRSLTDEKNRTSAILRSMTEGVVVVSPQKRVTFCNEPFRRALGIEGYRWEDRPAVELIRHSDLLQSVDRALSGKDTAPTELVIGSIRTRSFAVTAAPVRSNGEIGGAVMVLHDITDLRRLERARRDFVANVSHELRTPLTAIQGFAETLQAGSVDDAASRGAFLEIIRKNAERLGRLTGDLLKLAEIEAGALVLEREPVALTHVFGQCRETIRIKADEKRITLRCDFPPDLPDVLGDANALHEVLLNLLDNAVRYTPAEGEISVTAEHRRGEVLLAVADTGIGIPKAEQARIFERFYRVEPARSRETGGTGLGLAIVKHLIEAHDGAVRVESEVGKGSTFFVSLPPFTAS